ncbi:hypothetical protein X797_002126 [Metarhizium robertsii]|uniref:Uncharacterized protein n=2 Tax=Metarhizium robertsii TaxID=568076 RepID=E9EZW2_METRA|nr:uncharacterized protein MAA_05561 [Metarhizium robertsii ARSEF 23]EFY99503.1 hypothetical protein MAA_05561 [Metarhizium robertsii ARSEF 23]EXV04452.1 hypothetical protein X797_002126 [Metarhizium robertsii]
MKYSMLSVAAFVAASLASPAYFSDEMESSKPGAITINNRLNQAIILNPLPGKSIDVDDDDEFEVDASSVKIAAHGSYVIQDPPPSASLKLKVLSHAPPMPGRGQVAVKYHSQGAQFRYTIKRLVPHTGFPGVVYVQPQPQRPPQCRRLALVPGRPEPHPAQCRAGTKLTVTLCQKNDYNCPPRHHAEYDEAEWL